MFFRAIISLILWPCLFMIQAMMDWLFNRPTKETKEGGSCVNPIPYNTSTYDECIVINGTGIPP